MRYAKTAANEQLAPQNKRIRIRQHSALRLQATEVATRIAIANYRKCLGSSSWGVSQIVHYKLASRHCGATFHLVARHRQLSANAVSQAGEAGTASLFLGKKLEK